MNILLILFVIFIILLFILLHCRYNNYQIKESFSAPDHCTPFFSKNSFCTLNIDKNKCYCNFQKDDIKYTFQSPEDCCQRVCEELSPDQCVDRNNFTEIPYYCNIAGTCKKYEGTVVNSHISANNCGLDPLNNQLLLPYSSLSECEANIDPCDKYNNPMESDHVNKENCLKDVNCGYCTNDRGGGKCISGNASEPNDLQKYYYCNRNATTDANKYFYGDHVAYLLQKANISSFSNQDKV